MTLSKWKRLHSDWVIQHPWCNVRQDTVQLPNGAIVTDFFVHVRSDIVLICPVTSQQEMVFVRQYRHGVEEILLELPAGGFDPVTEAAEAAARRELQEETGYTTKRVHPLGILYDNPVKDTNKIHLFLAHDLHQTHAVQWDATEEMEVVLIPIADVPSCIAEGKICVAGTIAAVFLGLRSLDQFL